jgi:hypothetical protein
MNTGKMAVRATKRVTLHLGRKIKSSHARMAKPARSKSLTYIVRFSLRIGGVARAGLKVTAGRAAPASPPRIVNGINVARVGRVR